MAIEVKMKPDGKTLARRHQAMLDKLNDNKPAFKKISILLDRWVQLNFRTEGGKAGKWKPLKLGGRPMRGGGIDTSARILQDTGRLRASFKPFASKDNAGIGSDIVYSVFHEKGVGNLPIRRMLPNKNEILKEAEKIIERHVDNSAGSFKGK